MHYSLIYLFIDKTKSGVVDFISLPFFVFVLLKANNTLRHFIILDFHKI